MANKTLAKELEIQRFKERDKVQDMHTVLEQATQYTVEKVGNRRAIIKTDDKLSEKTKELLGKTNALNSKAQKTVIDRIELRELRKLIRREIHQDIINYISKIIESTIDESGSTKTARKRIQKGTFMLPKLRDRKGETQYRKTLQTKVAEN